MSRDEIKDMTGKMTLEEKASFCVGQGFWHLQGLERLGIPRVMVTDGPHGLRKQEQAADHLGLNESKTAICYPAGCALASGFDPKLSEYMGSAYGREAQAEGISTVLGPAMNIKRSPLCGRNFEYYSEDPLLSGKLAVGMIQGLQSQGVGACPKHFLANNQERFRFTSNSVVDERTMREIYLANFEYAVTEGKPWTIMGSYNRVNGVYACENQTYLTDILRGEWGFDGYTMTDWGACNDPGDGLRAGMDLVMPGPSEAYVKRILEQIKEGRLEEEVIDRALERILNIIFRYQEGRNQDVAYSFEEGHQVTRKIARECAVLLKNEDGILPLHNDEKILVIGNYAKSPRFQGGGSSHIKPYKVSGAWEVMKEKENVSFMEEPDGKEAALNKITAAAAKADKVVIFTGVPEADESEGVDRKTLNLPKDQEALILEIAKIQQNIIIVLHNGSAVAMPWINNVKAVLEVYLGGEAVGLATADLLYGEANPCGRLAETFPLRIEDTPTYPYYDVENDDVLYREGVLVGYRYYETMKKPVLFPFGYGLSYTKFSYSDLTLDKDEMDDTEAVAVKVTVTNTGKFEGKEVIQLYVSGKTQGIIRPERELRAFDKINLAPGESKEVVFKLDKRAFAYWNTTFHEWHVSTGDYQIQIGASASDILLEKRIHVRSTSRKRPRFSVHTPMGQMMGYPEAAAIIQDCFKTLFGGNEAEADGQKKEGAMTPDVMSSFMDEIPLRSLLSFNKDMKMEELVAVIDKINGIPGGTYH
ncbi:MAG TPA: glycosyl hydrolase [Clostridiales bacterium]|nr:glycosyl hydrolase [Clostridiales bacterium]